MRSLPRAFAICLMAVDVIVTCKYFGSVLRYTSIPSNIKTKITGLKFISIHRDAHLLKLRLKFTLKLGGCYMFRSTTIIRELAIEPG